VAANLLDILSFYESPEDFIRLYGIGPNGSHLQFKSVLNYKLWRFILLTIFLGAAVTSFLMLNKAEKRNSIPIKLVLLITFLGILWQIWAYYVWHQSGYDHYPGYDPFLF
jgi:hypothetical protein